MLIQNQRLPQRSKQRPIKAKTNEWKQDLDEWVPSTSLVNGKTLLTQDTSGKLTALDLESGQALWARQNSQEQLVGLALPNGPFIENTGEEIKAYDPQTGKLLWSQLAAPKVGNPMVSDGGHLLVTDYLESGSQIRRLDPNNGETLWTVPTNQNASLIDKEHFVGFNRDKNGGLSLSFHRLEDGQKMWESSLDHYEYPLGIAGSNLLLQHREDHENGNYYPVTTARNLDSGEVAWTSRRDRHANDHYISPDGSKFAFLEQREEEGWRDIDLVVLDAQDGSVKWSAEADSTQSIVLGQKNEILLKKQFYDGDDFSYELQARDMETGKELWKTEQRGGQLYASLENGDFLELKNLYGEEKTQTQITRIDSVSGKTEWTSTENQLTDFRLGAGESVNFVSGQGTFKSLDPKSGAVTAQTTSEDTLQTVNLADSGLVVVKDFSGKFQAIQTGLPGMMPNTPLFGDVPETDLGFNRVGLTETVRGVLIDGNLDGEVDAYDGVLVWKNQGEEQAQVNRVSDLDELKALDKNKDGQLALSELESINVWYDYDGDDKFTDEDIVMGLTSGYDRARVELDQKYLTLDRAYSSRAL